MTPPRRWLAAVAVLAAAPAVAQPPARTTSAAGTFAALQPGALAYTVLPANENVRAGDLLVTLPGAALVSRNGAVAVTCRADGDTSATVPVLDSGFAVNEPAAGDDFDITLDRGRIDLANTKPAGKAVARVRFAAAVWTVTLDAPGARVALELSGRWPPGTRFRPLPPGTTPTTGPTAFLSLVVLAGEASVTGGGTTVGLRAPPGPALVEWDSTAPADPQPRRVDRLPAWAANPPPATDAAETLRRRRAENLSTAPEALIASDDPAARRVGLVAVAAVDDLPALCRELAAPRTADAFDFAPTVARYWLGRPGGQDQRLYRHLTTAGGYTEGQARVLLQLLFGFAPADLARPETYEVLIDYLGSDKPAVRHLAAWHLSRLVPKGKAVPFRPNATAADWADVQAQWKKRIPSGEVPKP